jgi:autotransporter-associated beta strand protein
MRRREQIPPLQISLEMSCKALDQPCPKLNTRGARRNPLIPPLIFCEDAAGSELALNGNLTATGNSNLSFSTANTKGVSQVNLGTGTRVLNIISGTTTINSTVVSLPPGGGSPTPTRSATVGGFEKTGGGTLVLNAVNSYLGSTLISNGTLRLGASASIDISPLITVASGAIFDVTANPSFSLKNGQILQGGGEIRGTFTASSGSIISAGTTGADETQTLTFAAGLSLSSGSTTNPDLLNFSNFDKISVTGNFVQSTGAKIVIGTGVFNNALSDGAFIDVIDWTGNATFSTNLGGNLRDGSNDSGFDLDLPNIAGSGYVWDITSLPPLDASLQWRFRNLPASCCCC